MASCGVACPWASWGEADGEVLLHPDETVVTAIRTIFARFAETGSARCVWLRFRDQGLQLPLNERTRRDPLGRGELPRHPPGLEQPRLCGCLYGKTRTEMTLEPSGSRRKQIKHLPRDQWQVLIKEHHRGYIDWQTYEANQQRIARNTRPGPHKAGGAVVRAAHFCRASPLRIAATVCAHITGVALRRPDITVPASISSRGAAAIASTLVACRSTTLWHAPSLQRSSRRRSQRRWLLPNSWRWIARPRSSTGGSASSGRAMRQASPSAAMAVDPDNQLVARGHARPAKRKPHQSDSPAKWTVASELHEPGGSPGRDTKNTRQDRRR